MRLSRILVSAAVPAIVFGPAPAIAYDSSWYRTDFWAGEYPAGFTLSSDVSTKIRNEPLPDAARDIECALKKGQTYHPWNSERVKSSKLEFVTFVKKITYVLSADSKILLVDEKTDSDVEMSFKAGDEWTYLTYYGEGMFRLEFRGREYGADQGLFEVSKEKGKSGSDTDHDHHEWLRLTCANGATGWLLYDDVADLPAFERPDFPEYGKTLDRH